MADLSVSKAAEAPASSEDVLKLYATRLLDERGVTGVSPEVMEQMRADLLERIHDTINASILQVLPPAKYQAFSDVLDADDQAQVESFMRTHVPDLDSVLAKALFDFRVTYLA